MRWTWVLMVAAVGFVASAETLYNGIELPAPWPPADRPLSRDPMHAPYLEHPPAIIPIDVGRQLFVDDFLIESSTNLERTYHKATYYPENPVMRPDQDWERMGESQGHPAPTAMVFSDGVFYDPQDKLFKMWYMGGYVRTTCYAESKDGIHWEKPKLDIVPGTNIVQTSPRDSATVWLDLNEKDPARRYKLFMYMNPVDGDKYSIFFSADGKHWGERAAISGPTGDRCSVFYNPFRSKWVYSIRDYDPKTIGRFRRYAEGSDVLEAAKWEKGQPPFWVGADTGDAMRPDLNTPCELYNLDCAAYESVMIGLFSIWRGQPKNRAKPNEICIGFSRDGFHWQRPSHDPFIPVSERYGDWNWGNVQSAGGCCLVVGDKLYFYVSGRSGVKGSPASGVSATGLATLRRDGFASMDANGEDGTLTTRQVTFNGKYLFVNANARRGELRVEVLDSDSKPIEGFDMNACTPLSKDKTATRIEWKANADLASLSGKPVRFRFHLRNAELYSFWVSPDTSGASHGYVAAGGPGLNVPDGTKGQN